MKNNRFSNYTDGLIVERSPKDGPAPLDAGVSISGGGQGRNQFSNDEERSGSRAIDAATGACDTVFARANYFNEFAGSISGKVDTTGAFADPLSSALFETEPVPAAAPPIRLKGAFPNPTTGAIRFDVEASRHGFNVELQIVDVLGRLVRRIEAQRLSQGLNSIVWDGTDQLASRVANGIYFVRVRHDQKPVGAIRIVVAR